MKHPHQPRIAIRVFFLAASLFILSAKNSHAQNPDAQDMVGISAGGGYTFSHTDFEWTKTIPSPAFELGIHYFSLDFLSVNLDVQKGLLKGGASLSDAGNTKTGFENNYIAACLSFRFFPIALAGDNIELDGILKALSTIYGGTGVGYLYNDVKANNIPSAVFGSKTRYTGSNIFIPLELGSNFPVANIGRGKLMVNVNLRIGLCFSDMIDGYEPTLDANHHNDAFSTLTGGLVYKFTLKEPAAKRL